jgi:RHS repeat-associated protein
VSDYVRTFTVAGLPGFVMEGRTNDSAVTATSLSWSPNNAPDGSFTVGTSVGVGSYPYVMTTGLFNGDTNLDLVTANQSSGNVSILLGNGDGTFVLSTNYATGSSPRGVVIGDVDQDGWSDLVVANAGSYNMTVLLGNGDGTFRNAGSFSVGSYPYSVVLGDFNADEKLDVATANQSSGNVSVLLGNGDGSFGTAVNYAVGSAPYSLAVGRLNSDTNLDLVVANLSDGTVSVLLGQGDGTFAVGGTLAVGSSPQWVALGDMNKDGKQDVVVMNNGNNTISILRGNGDGSFLGAVNYPAGTSSSGQMVLADVNGDDWPDVAVADYYYSGSYRKRVAMLMNDGDGTLASVVYASGDYGYGYPGGLAAGDWNGDGRPDLALSDAGYNNNVTVLLGNNQKLLVEDPPGSGLWTGLGRGNLWSSSDVDYWSFSGKAGDLVSVAAEVPGNPQNSGLCYYLSDPNGNNIASFCGNYNGGYGQSSPVALPTDGTYTVRVSPSYDYQGEYRLRVSLARAPLQMESEPNDSIAQANALTITASGDNLFGNVSGYIETTSTPDYFNLGLITNGSSMFLSIRKPGGSSLAPAVAVYDVNGVYQAEVPGGRPEDGVAEVRITKTGTYYAAVRGLGSSGGLNSQYILGVQVVPTGVITYPNLAVSSIVQPTNTVVQSGQTITYAFTIHNIGTSPTFLSYWVDQVVLSSDTEFGNADDLAFGQLPHTGALNPGESYSVTNAVQLPDGISGDYHLIVFTDAGNAVNEFVFEGDNGAVANSTIHVNLAPYPDLQVENLAVSGPHVGNAYTLSWDSANHGNSAAAPGFRERITVLNETTGIAFVDAEQVVTNSIAPGTSVAQSRTFTVTNAGYCRVQVTTDARNTVYEYDGASHANAEVNNTTTASFQITALFTVAVASAPTEGGLVTGAGSYVAGTPVTVTATPNTDTLPYRFVNWTEAGTFRSSGASYTFAANRDLFLTANFDLPSYSVSASNNPSTAGTVTGTGLFKHGSSNVLTAIPGDGYRFASWMEDGLVISTNSALPMILYSNRFLVANYGEFTPDLQVVEFAAPATGFAGTSLQVGCLVTNQGNASAQGTWADGVYLSSNVTLNTNATLLGYIVEGRSVGAGGSYVWTNSVSLAQVSAGTYYLFVVLNDPSYGGGAYVIREGISTNNIAGPIMLTVNPVPPPTLTSPVYGEQPLLSGMVVSNSDSFAITASSPIGVDRVEFYVDNILVGTDSTAGDGYSALWNILSFSEGPHGVTFRSYDSRNNVAILTNLVRLVLTPPPAPILTAPADGKMIGQLWTVVQGRSDRYADHVLLYTNGVASGKTAGIEYDGAFTLLADLVAGTNRLSVAAVNRAGPGPASPEVRVIVDPTVPAPPTGLAASAQPGGMIRLSWWASAASQIKGYHVFRSTVPFETVAEAVKITSSPFTGTTFDDLPSEDGTCYYRVIAVNQLDVESPLSAQVNAISDRVAPRATVVYATTGVHVDDRYATGTVTVTLSVSEKLLSTPFFGLVRTNASPIPITLTAVSETNYTGTFDITAGMGTGPVYVSFSGRDVIGNRGTEVDSGSELVIDTEGPVATRLTVTPSSPIRNSLTNPVAVSVELAFDAQDVPIGTPVLNYALSLTHPIGSPVGLTALTNNVWRGELILPRDAGLTNELLSFAYQGTDVLGNVGTAVSGQSDFEVYQGALPALSPPEGLSAQAVAGGQVNLAWRGVDGASDFALYRQSPGEGSLGLLTNTTSLGYADMPLEGTNLYAVAAVRRANGQVAVGSLSEIVSAVADATPPGSPRDLKLAAYGNGLAAYWTPPTGTESLMYALYRSTSPIPATTNLSPLIRRIVSTNALDTNPMAGPAYYAVTAVDALGNESPPSLSAYTNISLLPVNSLRVDQHDGGLPVVSWSHGNADHISGYNVYLDEAGQALRINGAVLPNSTTTLTDGGYDRRDRRYSVAAVDVVGGTQVESAYRSILMPVVTVVPGEGATLKRGVMNRLGFTIRNDGSSAISSAMLGAQVLEHSHWSDPFDLPGGASTNIGIAVGGYPDLPDVAILTNSIVIVPNIGEQVSITTTTNLAVGDDLLVAEVLNEEFVRGTLGKARFVLHNTSTEEIEIVTAIRGGDAASPEIRFKLTDLDGMVLSVAPVLQYLGTNYVTLPNGTIVARLKPGESFTAGLTDIPIPVSAGSEVRLQIEIDQIHYHLGLDNHVVMPGLKGTRRIALVETPYYATVTNIFPEVSYGDGSVFIAGRVLERGTGVALARMPLKLLISLAGFERTYNLYSDAAGNWAYEFTPEQTEAGVYSVHAVHPSVVARPDHGHFEVRRLFVSPRRGTLNCPRNYAQTITVQASASTGMVVSNLNLSYEAADQPGGAFPRGILVITNDPITLVRSGQSTNLSCAVLGTDEASDSGTIVLRVHSDSPLQGEWGFVTVDYAFAGEASPALQWTPNFVETGVATSNSISEQVVLRNQGFVDMLGIHVAVVATNGAPAPDWMILNSASDLGALPVGLTKPISLTFSPGETVPLSGQTPYLFYLRVTAANHPTRDIPLYVNVDRSGLGNALFKVMDIYTGTLDRNGNVVQGLAGARLRLVKEEGSSFETNLVTDALGEVLVQNLPVGRYSVRLAANGHNDRSDVIWIKPGMTVSKDYTLESQLVTVEWSVKETTIQDKYEIVLNTTFQTDVPAPVVVMEPASLSLPDMAPGEVLNGEFTIKNYGLIRAQNVNPSMPPSDQYYKYEILGNVPATIEAKQSVRVPYRVTCLSRLEGDEESGGGGCRRYVTCMSVCYLYKCSNGAEFAGCTSFCFLRSEGGCGGVSSTTWSWGTDVNNNSPTGVGVPSGRPQTFDGVVCWPVASWSETWFDKDVTPWLDTINNIFFPVGCSVNCVTRDFTDDDLDLSVKVPGGHIDVKRWFYGNDWHWDHSRSQLHSTPNVSLSKEPLSIVKGVVTYERATAQDAVGVYVHRLYSITETAPGYRWQDRLGNWKDYDAAGFLIAYGTRNGTVGKLLYSPGSERKIVGLADRNDRQVVWFDYDNTNPSLLASARDVDNRRVEYTYTGGRLTKVQNVLTNFTTYEYNGEGRLIRKVDAGGRPTLVSYDGYGNVAQVLDQSGHGHFFSFNYDKTKEEYYAQIRSSSGRVKEVWYDAKGETKRVDINGRTIQTITKDGRNLIIADEKGNITRKDLDEHDNLTRLTYPDGSSVSTTYDPTFNLPTRRVDQRGIVFNFEYDRQGNLTNEVDAAGTSAERVTAFTYDSTGQLLSATVQGDGVTEPAASYFTYDEHGNLASTVDAMENTNRFLAYDTRGNMLQMQDARGHIWHFGYDGLGRLISQTDPATNVTSYAYDGANNRTNVVNALLRSFGFQYDDHNNLVKTIGPLADTRTYQYNTENLLTRETDPESKSLSTVYDNEGRVLRTVDGATNQTVFHYDETTATRASSHLPVRIDYPTFTRNRYYNSMQRLVREEDLLAGGRVNSRTFTYDTAGNLLTASDAEDDTHRFVYDALNRLIQTTDAAGGVTGRAFDDRGNVIAVEDPNGGITRYQYDRNNRLITLTRPEGQETRYEYDAAGNRTAVLDGKGQKVGFEYDAVNRLVHTMYFAAGNHTNPVKTVTFDYNALGDLVSWNDGECSGEFAYDELGRKTREVISYGSFALTNSYAYYANGLKKTFTGPDNIPYDYAYDGNNRLSALSVPGVGAVTWDSYSWNSPARITRPGGGKMDLAYDSLMRPTNILARDPSLATIMSRRFDYSPAGNILSKETEHGAYTYGYDPLYRLTIATNPASANEAYQYDPLGNRTNSAAISGPWNYNQNNELLGNSSASYTYDGNGNLTSKVTGSEVVNYVYDTADRLVRVEDGAANVIASYGYDPFGRRLWKEVAGIKTCFAYGDEGLIGEYAANGAELKTYGYVPGSPSSSAPIFQKTGGNYYWYQNDHLGTPQKLTDSTGNIVWAGTYDSFGNCQTTIAQLVNNLRFPGQYWDEETSLHYNWNRYYDPTAGRYLSTDPISEGQNLYAYVSGNPIVFIDPEGLCVLRIVGGLGEAALGFAAWETGWGVLVGLHGLDGAGAGVQSLVQWRPVDSYTSQGLQAVGVPRGGANLVDAVASMGGAFAAGKVLQTAVPASTKVSSWASDGITPDLNPGRWVQLGDATKANFWKTGLPGPKAYFQSAAPYLRIESSKVKFANSITGPVPTSSLQWPQGWEWWKGMLGQRQIKP